MYENSNKRLLFLPPSVQKGKEREPKCEDFICFDSRSLGQGAFGEVFKVRHKISGLDFAIKVIQKRKIIEKRMLGQLRREIRIMYSLSHPNIISLYSHFEDVNNFYLILELAEGGQLYKKLKKLKTFSESAAAQYMREVCLAVQYLHSRIPAVIHRDIKPENVLIDAEGRAKLGDFGWSNFLDDERDTYCGTVEYLAPEMVERRGHGTSLDIWALGVLLYELLTGASPFRSRTQEEIFAKIKQGKIVFPKSFPLLAKDLIKRMLLSEAERRPSVEMVLEHSWILSHAPLRPTAELVKNKVALPNVEEEGDVEFSESGCFVVSEPKTEVLSRNNLSAKSNLSSSKVNLEIALKLEEVKRISARIEKFRTSCFEIDGRIVEYKKEIQMDLAIDEKIEAIKKRMKEITHKNSLIFKRYTVKIHEIKIMKKRARLLEKKIWKTRNDLKIKDMKLGLFKLCNQHFMRINCFKELKTTTDELGSAIALLFKSMQQPKKYLKQAENQLSLVNSKLNQPSEIEKFIPEFKKIFSTRSRSVKNLSSKLGDLKSASMLQSQIIKTLRQ